MFEFFSRNKKQEAKPPVLLTTEMQAPGLIVPSAVLLKPKKWVTVKGQIGIVTQIDSSGYVKVDYVSATGETTMSVRVPVGEVKLARYMEIPECRRGDKVKAATLGYV